ncbi:protein activator of alkane oxidation PraB [Pseudomonas sp. MAFF 301514]|uniref:Protein activator of alkane oxidation PraB n=1 Tax=Pseudomonas allii TaxID=2740531 RepID=A0A7Y8RMT7_9PSED|nr:alkane oxidation protein activator PraB [Pseudomonas allii]NWN49027.1 protein activator of alkane oxidation PraB [Pseudomonas allii]NWN61410.1 protein activator of alkane oxidation PraB [Pseudomonas allii]
MKSLKTLVSLTALTVCMGAASMASAATITPAGPFTTSAGTIVVTSPSSAGAPITCGITFGGTVAGSGVVTITSAALTGGGLCGLPTLKNIPSPGWVLTATSYDPVTKKGTATVTNVGWTVAFPPSNCGAGTLNLVWDETTQTLSTPSSQPLSGNCAVQSLTVKAPTLHVQ